MVLLDDNGAEGLAVAAWIIVSICFTGVFVSCIKSNCWKRLKEKDLSEDVKQEEYQVEGAVYSNPAFDDVVSKQKTNGNIKHGPAVVNNPLTNSILPYQEEPNGVVTKNRFVEENSIKKVRNQPIPSAGPRDNSTTRKYTNLDSGGQKYDRNGQSDASTGSIKSLEEVTMTTTIVVAVEVHHTNDDYQLWSSPEMISMNKELNTNYMQNERLILESEKNDFTIGPENISNNNGTVYGIGNSNMQASHCVMQDNYNTEQFYINPLALEKQEEHKRSKVVSKYNCFTDQTF